MPRCCRHRGVRGHRLRREPGWPAPLITEQTYYRWRKEYGGLKVDQAKRLEALEKENAQLKRLVAELSLDKSILEIAAEGNF